MPKRVRYEHELPAVTFEQKLARLKEELPLSDQLRLAVRRDLESRRFTQRAFAEVAGLHFDTVNRLLAGRSTGKVETWERILRVLGLTVLVQQDRLAEPVEGVPARDYVERDMRRWGGG